MKKNLSVREILSCDIPDITSYWLNLDRSDHANMGVDPAKIPTAEQLEKNLQAQIETPYENKQSYCVIWLVDDVPIGHSNTNPTSFGNEAFMHLHVWGQEKRNKGLGADFLKLTLPYFFKNLQLENLFCQPYALNPAPNKTLEKVGFEFVKEYVTVPGSLNFEQPVKLWQLSLKRFEKINKISQ